MNSLWAHVRSRNLVVVGCIDQVTSQLPNYRPFLKEIKSMGEMRIVLDCRLDTIHEVLKQAQQVGVKMFGAFPPPPLSL